MPLTTSFIHKMIDRRYGIDPNSVLNEGAPAEEAARGFIKGKGVKVDLEKNQAWLSKIFQWYAQDFNGAWLGVGGMSPVLAYIVPYLNDPTERKLLSAQQPKVKFISYDWTPNTW